MGATHMPTTDLQFTESSSDSRHAQHVGVEKDFGNGIIAVMMLANGAVAEGAVAGITGAGGSAEALTNAILTALTASRRKGMEIGACQASGGAATGEYFWAVKRNPNESGSVRGDVTPVLLTENAVADNAQITTTTTAGAVDDVGGVGTYDIEGVEVITGPGSGTTFTAWRSRTPMQINPTVN